MDFVPRHRGTDNVLIAQELFYALDRKKGKVGYMAVKLDLEKAYDQLEWSFIQEFFKPSTFPQNYRGSLWAVSHLQLLPFWLMGAPWSPWNQRGA